MRKIFNSIVAVALAVAATASLTACSSDDDDEPEIPTEKTIKEVTLATSLYVDQAMADIYDIVGTDSEGKTVSLSANKVDVKIPTSETLSMYALRLEGKGKSAPLNISMKVSFSLKEGVTVPEKSDYVLATEAKGAMTYSDGTIATFATSINKDLNGGVKAENIDRLTESLNKTYGQFEASIDSDGNIKLKTSIRK